jgi:hypothetical protein
MELKLADSGQIRRLDRRHEAGCHSEKGDCSPKGHLTSDERLAAI